jgi:hypothetical protein
MATPIGHTPTEIVLITVLSEVRITDTVSSLELVTYANCPLGVMAIVQGHAPTEIVSITVLSEVRITDTVSSLELVTYANCPLGVMAIPTGSTPTDSIENNKYSNNYNSNVVLKRLIYFTLFKLKFSMV